MEKRQIQMEKIEYSGSCELKIEKLERLNHIVYNKSNLGKLLIFYTENVRKKMKQNETAKTTNR